MSESPSSKFRTALPYLVIVAIFLATAAYVLTVQPGRSAPLSAATPSPSAFVHSDGLSDSSEGYLMRAVALPEARGEDVPVSFQILGPDGLPLRDYETVQERLLHLYLIRDDISGYQHLHPTLENGHWSTTMDVPDGGAYRLYAEFTPKGRGTLGHPTILGLPFIIAGDTKLAPLPGPAPSSVAGPHTVTRLDGIAHLRVNQSQLLKFKLEDGVALEPYLGSAAHMSAFEVRTGALDHVHAATTELTFHALFVNRGEYRLFLEFQTKGEVHRAAFTIFVT